MKAISERKKCPKCKASWDGKDSRLLHIEIREQYDGVSFHQCAECQSIWDRWTGKEVKDFSAKRTFIK